MAYYLHNNHILTTTANPASSHSSSSSPRVYAKPSHFIIHSKRRHQLQYPRRFQVSCSRNQNGGDDDDETSRRCSSKKSAMERRNILLGLGGLYGAAAANLVSAPPSWAETSTKSRNVDAIETPEGGGSCGLSEYRNHKSGVDVKEECCPPSIPENSIDYKLPHVIKTRRPAHSVSPGYIDKYKLATQRMRDLSSDDPRSFDAQAKIHCAYCNGAYNQSGGLDKIQVHESWLFFPFHRWYLYFYERILGSLIHDPEFALPYWSWDHPDGMTVPAMFTQDEKSSLYDKKRNWKNIKSSGKVDLGMGTDLYSSDTADNNLFIMYNEMLGSPADAFDFMGGRYVKGTKNNPGQGSIERGCHTAVHAWVGDPKQPANEDMGNFYSAGYDPLFYCHHANVDRMWTLWQENNKVLNIPSLANDDRFGPQFLDASFLFYDENKRPVRVTVADCLDNSKMGYQYDNNIGYPWAKYKSPPPKIIKAKEVPKHDDALIPLDLYENITLLVDKAREGKQNEILVFEGIIADPTKSSRFNVFVSRKDEDKGKGIYAGTWARVQHDAKHDSNPLGTNFRLDLSDLYEGMGIKDDDDAIRVVLMPQARTEDKIPGLITIDTIKIILNEHPEAKKWRL